MRHSREPFESEIVEEIEERLQEERESARGDPDEDVQDLEMRFLELQGQMDAINDRLEAKMEASNKRLETKVDESISRMEAMFREILAGKASHTDSTVTQSTSLQDTIHPVPLQVTPAPTAIIETARPPSPTLAASGVSHPSGQEQTEIAIAEDVGGGTSMEEAEGGGTMDGEVDAGATTPPEVVEKAVEDDAYAIANIPAPGELAHQVN